ncbi:MAG: hypothetical protein NXI18_09125 [Alphaproteobacteria bacterium]|nr:hypothetical protein [Alphaproteobacteria bacterium]
MGTLMVFLHGLGQVLWRSAVHRTRKMALCAALLGVAVLGGCVFGAPYAKSYKSSWQLLQSAISPDGGEVLIVYIDRQRRQGHRVYILDIASGSQRRVPLPAHISWSNPSFHPLDPDRVLLTARCTERSVCPDSDIGVRLYDVRLSTAEARPLTPAFERGKWELAVGASTYNADATKIASLSYDILESPFPEDQIRVSPDTTAMGVSVIDTSTGRLERVLPTESVPLSFGILSAPEFINDDVLLLLGGAEKNETTGERHIDGHEYPWVFDINGGQISKIPIESGSVRRVTGSLYLISDEKFLFLTHQKNKDPRKNESYIYEIFISDGLSAEQITDLDLPLSNLSYSEGSSVAAMQVLNSGNDYYEQRIVLVNVRTGDVRSLKLPGTFE